MISPTIAQVFAGGQVYAIARQPDGKVIVGGTFDHVNGVSRSYIARLNANGTLDATWDPQANNGVDCLALDLSGNVYVGGSFTHIGGQARSGLARLSGTGSGAADATWDPNPDRGVVAMALDPGGFLFVAGDFTQIGGRARSYIAKLSTSGAGAADATWNASSNGHVAALALDGNGSLFVGAGWDTFIPFFQIGGQTRARIAKLSTTGTGAADLSWDPNPQSACYAGNCPHIDALVPDGSGGLYLGGYFTEIGGQPRGNLAKLSTTGTGAADPTWNPVAFGEVAALALDGAGNIFAGGLFNQIGSQSRTFIAKVSSSGAGIVDPTWNPPVNWAGTLWIGGYTSVPFGVLVVEGGQVYAGGTFTNIGGQTRPGFAVLSSTGAGAVDPSWGAAMLPGSVRAIARDGSGRTVIGGNFQFMGDGLTVRNRIARLSSGLTLDATWAPEANNEVDALAIDPGSGAVYAGGQFNAIGGQARAGIAKLSGSGTGTADPTWNPNANGPVVALALDTAISSVFAGGSFSTIGGQSRNNIAKLSTSGAGAADATWDPNATPGLGFPTVQALAVDLSGNLYAGGNFTHIGGQSRAAIARLSTSGAGAADPAWDPSATLEGDGMRSRGSALLLDGAGSLYVGGLFDHIGGQTLVGLARLSVAAGAADASWHPDPYGVVALALEGTSTVYAGGSFGAIGGGYRWAVARLLPGGTADCEWIANASTNSVSALALDGGGNLYVGGAFTTIAGTQRNGFAVLAPGSPPGCQLGITGINGGIPPSANVEFAVVVQSQDSTGLRQTVVTATTVTLSRHSGTGTLGGTLSCQIPAGSSTCTVARVSYSTAESGVVLRASSTAGDTLSPGDSQPFTVIAAPPPVQIAFTGVNGGSHPIAGTPFDITVQTLDSTGAPVNVVVDTDPAVVVNTGTGVLSSPAGAARELSCHIAAGTNTCTVVGAVYSTPEPGVILTTFAAYGSGFIAGNSQPLTVDAPAGKKVLTVQKNWGGTVTSTPPGVDCTVGVCSALFAAGTPVTLAYSIDPSGLPLGSWGTDCSGSSCAPAMSADRRVTINHGGTGSSFSSETFAVEPTTVVAGSQTERVDQPQTRIVGRYLGALVYDHTFGAALSDPEVQAGMTAAGDAVRAAAGTTPVVVPPPVLTATSDTLLSSLVSNRDVVTATDSVVSGFQFGPQTLPVGELGICVEAPSNCAGPHATLVLSASQSDLYVLFVAQVHTSRTIVTTDTHQVSQTYTVADVPQATITATAGTPQSAHVGTAFATPLKAKVADAGGHAISSVTVTFTAPSSGASGTFPGGLLVTTAQTDISGVATAPVFTANATVGGPYTVTASISGLAPAGFSLTNTPTCLPGDVNGDGSVNVADVFYLINYLFAGGPTPPGCPDVNGDTLVNVADVFYLINYLFAGGPAPV